MKDKKTYNIGDQFYMGDWLLVAPIIRKAAKSRKVYLPQGTWYDMWSNKRHTGPRIIKVDAPLYKLESLPVFVRAGAIIPRQPFELSLSEQIPQHLSLDIYPSKYSCFALYESENITNQFSCEQKQNRIIVTMQNKTNFERTYQLRLHEIKTFLKVYVDGKHYPNMKTKLNPANNVLIFIVGIKRNSCRCVEIYI